MNDKLKDIMLVQKKKEELHKLVEDGIITIDDNGVVRMTINTIAAMLGMEKNNETV